MKHIDSYLHTRGAARYVDDWPRADGMLHLAVFGSPVAHGHIRSLDVTAAADIDGVVAVLTAADIPGENQIGPIIADETLLAEKEVHYCGQPVAIAAAESAAVARRALEHIRMDVDPLPVVTDPRVAHELGEVIGVPRTFAIGDPDAVWDSCETVVEGRCDVGGQEHVYLETHRARAVPLEGRVMRVYSSTQSPYAAQKMVAKILDLPNHFVEVDVKRLGGAFGGKEDQATAWACLAALAASQTGRPSELVLRRDEDIRMTGKRHPYSSDFKMGLSAEGKILAYEVKHFQNAGAAADLSPAVLERTLFHSTNSYFIPNVRIHAVSCRTNLPPNTAFRGFGGPQGMFVIECAIAKAAAAMGIPREDIQRRNLLSDGDSFPYGQLVRNGRAERTWDEAASKYGLGQIRTRIDGFNARSFAVKKGVAVMPVCFGISFTSTFMNQASALVHVYTDGSVSVTTGGVEMGQGISTNMLTVAARGFGISPSRIKVESTNTTRIANMSPSAASSTTMLNGNAVLIAVDQILGRLRAVAAEELGSSSPQEITLVDEIVHAGGKAAALTWSELVQKAYLKRVGLSAHGFFATPGIHFDKKSEKGNPFAYHVYGTAIVEVTLDCIRGVYDVDSVKIVHDLGRPLNELVDLGQVEGGLAQGLGWMTMEDLRFDENGRIMSGALATYKVPDAYFMPDDIQVHFLEAADEALGPFGNKAVGEPPLMYGIGVYFAIRDAMRAFLPGRAFDFSSPMTPERVLLSLHHREMEEINALVASGDGTVEYVPEISPSEPQPSSREA